MAVSLTGDLLSYATVVLVIVASTYLLLLRNRRAAAMAQMAEMQRELEAAGGLLSYLHKLHSEQLTVHERIPLPNAMSTVDPALIKATMLFADRPTDFFRFLDPIAGENNLATFPADQAIRMRKLLGGAFTHEALEMKYPQILDIALGFVKKWERLAEEMVHENVIMMQREGLSLSIRFSVKALFRSNASDVDMSDFQERYDKVTDGLYDRQFGFLSPEREAEVERDLPRIKEFIDRSISPHIKGRRNGTEPKKQGRARDFLQIVLEENDPETQEPFTDEMAKKLMNLFLVGAYHTTGVAVSWAMSFIAEEPKVQARLQDEIDKVLQGRVPTLQDLAQMEYVGQVVKESLRMASPGGFAVRMMPKKIVTRTSTNDMLTVKPGTTIIVPTKALHDHHFVNPERFDPDRFAPNASEKVPRFGYSPFGYGVRVCPGERLAVMELKLMICLVMQKFDLELACEKDKIVRMERMVVMAKDDIPIRMTKRKRVSV